ncbi:MAG: hypothetical protein JWO31_4179 [Phycisphaerales bacterium]|nr:hypothetical protein [Phycisphaerales bacterium]
MPVPAPSPALAAPPAPDAARRAFERLAGQRRALAAERDRKAGRLDELKAYLAVAPQVEAALEQLGDEMFGKLAAVIESHLTLALQEVLGQPIRLRVEQDFKRGGATLKLHVERDGRKEDIMRGTGGSVANILSVGLRLFALSRLDPATHRRFLVLDEQDCWLAPDLVPRLVKIIRDAGRGLGFQVVMISHHPPASFERYADRIYRFTPGPDGVQVEPHDPPPRVRDREWKDEV